MSARCLSIDDTSTFPTETMSNVMGSQQYPRFSQEGQRIQARNQQTYQDKALTPAKLTPPLYHYFVQLVLELRYIIPFFIYRLCIPPTGAMVTSTSKKRIYVFNYLPRLPEGQTDPNTPHPSHEFVLPSLLPGRPAGLSMR